MIDGDQLSFSVINVLSLDLPLTPFGYNLRVRHLEYDTDEKGDGLANFVPQKQLRNND